MKNTFLFSITAVIFSVVILMSCSKDASLKTDKNVQHGTSDAIAARSIYSGTVTGLLSPVPVTATVHAVHSSGNTVVVTSDTAGRFHIENLQEGIYTLLIEYIPSSTTGTADITRYKKIQGVRVVSNADTDLGVITAE